jgi:hypothetical protein
MLRRSLIKISVFVLLGAIVNVAVAWGCAWSAPGVRMPWPMMLRAEHTRFGARHVKVIEHDTGSVSDPAYQCGFFGLPFVSMKCSYRTQVQDGITLRIVQHQHGSEIYTLPLMPLWPGFAINSIFYAAMFWVLWIAPGKVRRFIRIRCHRCPACGYQIAPGTGAVCSECGQPIMRGR